MTESEIAKRLLLGEKHFIWAYSEYLIRVREARKFKHYYKVDFTSIDTVILKSMHSRVRNCEYALQSIVSSYDLPFNMKQLSSTRGRMGTELGSRVVEHDTKGTRRSDRQEKARQNRNHGRSKNR